MRMTLSAQLEALNNSSRPRAATMEAPSKKVKNTDDQSSAGDFSYIRRKLYQLRSGRWRKEKSPLASDGLTRSHSLGRVDVIQSREPWSGSSLPSLDENQDQSTPVAESPQPSSASSPVVRLRKKQHSFSHRNEVDGTYRRSRPQSYAGLEHYLLDNVIDPVVTKPASVEALHTAREPVKLRRTESQNEPKKSRTLSSFIHRNFSGLYEVNQKPLIHDPPSLQLLYVGRSRSLTQMEALEPETVFREETSAAAAAARLEVPPPSQRRRPLARSQVSSSEYFSVSFDLGVGTNSENESNEFLIAAKGTSLAAALSSVCRRRGVELEDVNVYLESCKNPPLPPLTTETSWLGGKHIVIKSKEERKDSKTSTISKSGQLSLGKHQGSCRRKSGRFSSTSIEETTGSDTTDFNRASGKSRQRWSGLFSNSKDTKMGLLVEFLNNYSKHGIPLLTDTVEDLEEALYNLEEDWRYAVKDVFTLGEKIQQQQTAIWELIQTELAYIRSLKVVNDFFLSCLTNLQNENILTEIDKSKLFSNIGEIFMANRNFWYNHMFPMLANTRETGKPLNPQLLFDGFCKFDELFQPYTKYCAEQSQCQQYCREKHQENELFTTYLVWCETQKGCNRLGLIDILVKPMQRLTKYSLLLRAIQKHTEIEEHRLSLDTMIRHVDLFVNSVNTTLKRKQDMERLREISTRIEPYDVVESKDEDLERLVKSYNELDLTCPMPGCSNSQRRHLILESDLRLKDSSTSKIDVHCFLFTDMLLICKPATRKSEGRVRVLRQPYLVERLVVQELQRDPASLALVYLTEYRVPSAAFLLISSDTTVIKNWSSALRKAQDLYSSAKRATAGKLSRQPSSFYEDEIIEDDYDSHSIASLGLFPTRSPRGSTRGSSLNHSHSGSVEMEGGGVVGGGGSSVSSISQSRGVSVENEIRGSSQSSDEGIPQLSHEKSPPRRKCTSPNTLSIKVPVFSSLGQSLPDLNQVSAATTSSNSSMLLVPPRGSPHRGITYPPPSPPLRRATALTPSRNPPLLKTRHIGGGPSLVSASCDVDVVPIISGVPQEMGDGQNQRFVGLKRNARSGTVRYPSSCGAGDEARKLDVSLGHGMQKKSYCTVASEGSSPCGISEEVAAQPSLLAASGGLMLVTSSAIVSSPSSSSVIAPSPSSSAIVPSPSSSPVIVPSPSSSSVIVPSPSSSSVIVPSPSSSSVIVPSPSSSSVIVPSPSSSSAIAPSPSSTSAIVSSPSTSPAQMLHLPTPGDACCGACSSNNSPAAPVAVLVDTVTNPTKSDRSIEELGCCSSDVISSTRLPSEERKDKSKSAADHQASTQLAEIILNDPFLESSDV
ncbi:pleckstrin homology domain-containing family G member 5 isoform X3 [Nilaparvata lugens]|uniref:pleckstrin homology domain-containing family G member 5 isoform X3 n=1 Tax=Nilaparvata lugens TaxID=108931 RepID=UPI00193CA4FE|nr:pleckstrin homology domain-containing family G member 5 isoform X3 [Nilaparvata lugens]XP_039280849.1 pleckstrin homology domain-containing family G member 5 isoform X3 [Nilaparvata lugens]